MEVCVTGQARTITCMLTISWHVLQLDQIWHGLDCCYPFTLGQLYSWHGSILYTCYNWHNTNTKLENCCYKSDSTEKKLIFYIQQGVNKTQNLKSRDWIEKELKSWMMKYKSWLITQVNCNSRWIFVFSFGHTDRLLQLLKLLSQLKSGMFLMWTKDKVLGLHLYFTLQLLAGDN